MTSTHFANASGPYRLRDLKNGHFQIHKSNGPAFEGPKHLIAFKAQEMGIEDGELYIAFDELNKTGDDYAEFGIFGKFMFTQKDSKKRVA